jgi:transglutaminase-like putative cysteine protease
MGLHNMLALALLLVIVVSISVGIVRAVGGLESVLLVIVAVLGMLLGWLMAETSLSGWKASILIFVLGFVGLFLRVGQLGDEFAAVLQASVGLARDVLPWVLVLAVLQRPPQSFAVDWMPLMSALAGLWSGVGTMVVRVYDWLRVLATGGSAVDPVAATLVWGLALWSVSSWASWTLRRRTMPLLAISPGGALLMATLSYRREETLVVVLTLLGAVLPLAALVTYSTRQRRWQLGGIDFPELGGDTALAVIIVSVMLVVFAALAPSITIQNIVDFIERFAPPQTGESGPGGVLPVSVAPSQMEKSHFGDLQSGGLPRSHLLGSGPELSERLVMTIKTGELPSGPQEIFEPLASRHYWRSITYDIYTGRGWATRDIQTSDYLAEESLDLLPFEAQLEVQQEVRIVGDVGGLLHATGALDTVDQDYTVAWRSHEDMFGATLESTTYRAVSLVSIATEEQLRSAGSDYPEWIQDRYLALPDTVPDRVLGLARDLTATEPTPYDRALAIETFLRSYPYNLDVSLPPAGTQDVVDYFLFDLREGYCDYYATSMVVLARAAGLPARLVLGYAPGAYEAHGAVYIVTEAEAHAWAEVYFPEYGWIEFEPTGGRPPIHRSHAEDVASEVPDLGEMPESTEGVWKQAGQFAWLGWLLVPALPLLLGAGWLIVDNRRLRRLAPPAAAAKLYQRVRDHGRQLAVPMRMGDTPYEFAESFAEWAATLAREKRWGEIVAEVVFEVRRLINLYVEASYSAHPMRAVDSWHLLEAWKRLRWRLWLARLFQWKPSSSRKVRRSR